MHKTGTVSSVQLYGWATPKPGMTLMELKAHLLEIGNKVLEVDEKNNRIKVVDVTETM